MSLIGEDCHYFITGGCTRGNQCCFRHQPAARMTENPCPEWIQGKCLNPNCGLRHVPVDRYSMKKKGNTPCFYDNHPGGCRNALCPFLHTKKGKVESVPPAAPVINEAEKTTVRPTPTPEPVTIPAAPQVEPTPQVVATNVKPAVSANLIPPPPAPVHTLKPALGTPTMVNGVLTIAPSRGILGASPNIAQVPGVQLLPPLVTQHAGIRQNLVSAQNQQPLQGPARSNSYSALPKTGHFNEQVRLFKEMLSAKQKSQHSTISNKKHYNDGSDSFSSEEENDRRNKDKHKKRNRKEKRDRNKKRSNKDFFSKGDEEVLYGDYKDIPIDKKHKKSKSDRRNGADTKVEVKSYEQVLREKALRKMKERKKKQKFDHDFEDILQASDGKKKSRSRKSSADDETSVDAKRKNRKESIDLDTVVFSKEDAIDLDIGEDDFDNELNNEKSKNRKQKEQTKLKRRNSEKNASSQKEKPDDSNDKNDKNDSNETIEKPEEVEQGVLIIPDETTDLTFSVDDTDDLALELTQEPETAKSRRRRPPVINKKVSSIVSCVTKPTEASTSSRHKKSNDSNGLEQKTSKNKRKILVVDSDSPVEAKKNKDELVEQLTEPKKVISLVRREEKKKNNEESTETKNKTDTVKIKTFEEIMAEKRKRKLEIQSKDVVVLSDNDSIESPAKKKNTELLKERSEKFKSSVLQTKNENKVTDPPPKTAAMLRREKLQLAKQEYEKRRKSQQIYQVKGAQATEATTGESGDVNTTTETTTATKAGNVKKVKLNRPALAKESDDAGSVTVRSFEEIMKEKRLRRQREMQAPAKITKRVDSKPIQSFLRRRSLSNQRNLQESQPIANEVPTTVAPETAEQPVVTTSVTTVPVAKVIGRRRSSSGSSSGAVPTGESKPAPIKLKRKSSTTDCKVPSISPPAFNNKSNESKKNVLSPESVVPSISSEKPDLINQSDSKVLTETNEPESSIEDIQEALDEKKRLREQDMLSDDEFENYLLSEGDDDDQVDDVNDDDFMMELEQMIDS